MLKGKSKIQKVTFLITEEIWAGKTLKKNKYVNWVLASFAHSPGIWTDCGAIREQIKGRLKTHRQKNWDQMGCVF